LLGNNLEVSRIGIVVGNKISKKATVRNKLKRQLREIICPELGKIRSGYDLIISVLPAATDKTYQELEKAVFAGLSHFKLL
jgi:ribonuclease P protein component